jgi:hypothetical protein
MASWLDEYQDDFATMKARGMKQTEMIRELKERYGVEVKPQTLSDYLKKLPEGERAANAQMQGATYVLASQEDVQVQAVMHAAGDEVLDRLAQLIEGVQQLKREADEKGLKVQEALERHSRAFEALYGTFKGAVLGKIWLRALVITGGGWGLGSAALYLWGWPF